MTSVFIRIVLRYAAAALVARGLFGSDDAATFTADPDIQMLLETGFGLAMGAVTEGWHLLARKFGWDN
ncbi:hypothetical protein [Mesorhizobium sp. M0139]|uniref:hypothetical protein n=1 Tax=Mesorhizobium sp. M0139 TaxID=2956892 RepID=UPI00333A3D7C